jgi:hypothetical protein
MHSTKPLSNLPRNTTTASVRHSHVTSQHVVVNNAIHSKSRATLKLPSKVTTVDVFAFPQFKDIMSSIARACYTRNGTHITEIDYQPCDTNPSRDSVCCGTNHQGAGHPQVANDVCESNGLCQNFEPYDGTNAGAKIWWRQGCTDPTWQSEDCLKNVCNYDKVSTLA